MAGSAQENGGKEQQCVLVKQWPDKACTSPVQQYTNKNTPSNHMLLQPSRREREVNNEHARKCLSVADGYYMRE